MSEKLKRWLVLFVTMMAISSTANSGLAILSVIKNTFVQKRKWITEEQMNDYIALCQSSPGPLAINASNIVGYHVGGIGGAVAAVLGCAIPPLVIMLLVSVFYSVIIGNDWVRVFMKGMQAGVIAMLVDLIWDMFKNVTKEQKIYPIAIMVVSFLFAWFTRFSTFFLVIGCIAVAVASFLLKRKEGSG